MDLDDYLRLRGRIYKKIRRGYLATTSAIKKWTVTYVHQDIMNYPDSSIDHINTNKLDNRKDNLRLSSHSLNGINRGSVKGRFVGVSVYNGKYRAIQTYKKTVYNLGLYDSEIEAARIVNLFRIKIVKESIYLNNTGDDLAFFIPIPLSYWPKFKKIKFIYKHRKRYVAKVNYNNKQFQVFSSMDQRDCEKQFVRFMLILIGLYLNMQVDSMP